MTEIKPGITINGINTFSIPDNVKVLYYRQIPVVVYAPTNHQIKYNTDYAADIYYAKNSINFDKYLLRVSATETCNWKIRRKEIQQDGKAYIAPDNTVHYSCPEDILLLKDDIYYVDYTFILFILPALPI